MKKSTFLIFFLILSLALSTFTAFAVNDGEVDATSEAEIEAEKNQSAKDEIPYGDFEESFNPYGYQTFTMMTADEAQAAGVPEGYEGYVLKLESKSESGVGIGLDLTQYRVNDIESITFRVWCPKGTKNNGVRLTNTQTDSWIMLANPGATEEWVEVVLSETSNFNTATKNFSVFDDGNGYCKRVNFVIRHDSTVNTITYIDSISVKLRDPDTVGPVISYNGDPFINTTAGKEFALDVTAYDEYDEAYVEPEYIFSEGAVDENGLLLEGEHTCTVRFTDLSNNVSELRLVLNVFPTDAVAPVINWSCDKIYATVGMHFLLNVTATDDRDGEIDVQLTWSEGAFDDRARLCKGEHTLILTAVDTTGNKTEKVVSVIVTEGLPK